MKEKLTSALGTFGLVLWYIVSFLYSFSPLVILHFGFLIDLVLIIVMTAVPFFGELVRIALYIWATVVVCSAPIDAVSIVFFIFAALYLVTTIIPLILSLIPSRE